MKIMHIHSHKIDFAAIHVGLLLLCLFSFLITELPLVNASSSERKNGSFIGISPDGNLVLRPPMSRGVEIHNLTELSAAKEELSDVKAQLSSTQASLSSALSMLNATDSALNGTQTDLSYVLTQLSSALYQLNITNSAISGTQAELSVTKGQVNTTQADLSSTKAQLSSALSQLNATDSKLNATQADLSSALTQLSSAMSRVDSLESLSDILPSSFTLSGTPLTGLKSSYACIGGNLTITNNQNLKSVSLPFLTAISGSITITGNPLLSEVSLPFLSTLGGTGSAYYILIEYNAPTITVSLLSLDLTSLSYSISALNMTCTALVPHYCSQSSIFVLGGDLGNGTLLYSFSKPQWSTTAIPAMSTSRQYAPAAAFCPKSNAVYTAGGMINPVSLSSAAKLSLDTKQWTDIASMKMQRGYTPGVCFDDGETFMVCGGYNGAVLSSCELLNPSNGTWAYTQNMTIARHAHAMVLYNDKPVVLGGRQLSWTSFINSGEEYNPALNSWSSFPSFKIARDCFGAAVVAGKIFIAGGRNDSSSSGALRSVEYYDNGTTWTTLSSPLPAGATYGCAAVPFQNKLVVLSGTQKQVDVFDPSNNTWSTLPALSKAYLYITVVAF